MGDEPAASTPHLQAHKDFIYFSQGEYIIE